MDLEKIQKEIKNQKLDAIYVSRNSIFIGQDILDDENLIEKLTSFSGSAGELVITKDMAYLFVDSRYTIQARLEVDLEKVCIFDKISDLFFKLYQEKKQILKVGINPWTTPKSFVYRYENDFVNFVETDIIDIPKTDKKIEVFELEVAFSGVARDEKISMVANYLCEQNSDIILICGADNTSWLLNLRSNYLPNSPIFRGFVMVDIDENVIIFSDDLERNSIEFEKNIKILPIALLEKEIDKNKKKRFILDKDNTSIGTANLMIKNKIYHCYKLDICQILKSQKNETEMSGIKNAHIRDGLAVTKFLFWLEKNYIGKSEIDVANKLYEFRKNQKNFFSNSFETISGFAENGAIVHYHANQKSNKKLDKNSLLLLDSGGQYFDGTTDITRTIAIGSPTKEMREDYTLVLKSHIALAGMIFPKGTKGFELSAISKYHLWQSGKNFGHGTSHGVGHFLNVHEGPQSISKNGNYELKEDMIISIEPGYYKENEYGIRIENLYQIVKAKVDGFLAFEYLTLVFFDNRLINFDKISIIEKKWLERYNKRVYKALYHLLEDEEKKWLETKLEL